MRANKNGAGVGEHEFSFSKQIGFKCKCGLNFIGTYSEVQSDLTVHLKDECPSVFPANTKRLTRVIRKFEELGLHPTLVMFYKNQNPFYYVDPIDEGDEELPTKKYVSTGKFQLLRKGS